jgi:hypothetical protein
MVDSLDFVFPAEVRAALAAKVDDAHVRRRLDVLAARSPAIEYRPGEVRIAAHDPANRARRAAWEAYFDAASTVGLFDGDDGRDLLARLRGPSEDGFRGALAECLVTWVLAGKLRLRVRPRPRGKRGTLELAIDAPGGQIAVEVKTIRVPRPAAGHGFVDYRRDVEARLKRASEQFSSEGRNLLVIVFDVWLPVHRSRDLLVNALFAQQVIRIPVYLGDLPAPPGLPGEPTVGVSLDGSLLRPRKRPSREPFYTRVGAVLSIEEDLEWNGSSRTVEHRLLLVRNPAATFSLEPDLWGSTPRCEEVAGEIVWSDGEPVLP